MLEMVVIQTVNHISGEIIWNIFRKFVRFHGLRVGPSPKIFTKTLKVSVTPLRKLKIILVIIHRRHSDSSKVAKRNRNSKEHNSIPLTKPGVPHKLGKICTNPKQFLGIKIDSEEMTFSIPIQKIQEQVYLCQKITQSPHLSIRNFASIINKLRATASAFSQASPLQVRYLENLLRENLKSKSYESQIPLST